MLGTDNYHSHLGERGKTFGAHTARWNPEPLFVTLDIKTFYRRNVHLIVQGSLQAPLCPTLALNLPYASRVELADYTPCTIEPSGTRPPLFIRIS